VEAVRDAMLQAQLADSPPALPVSEEPPPLPPEPVVGDLPCLRCGYRLTGLSSAMACPECGCSVRESMKGDLLEYAGDEELERLWRGVLLVEVSMIASVVIGLLSGLVGAAIGAMAASGNAPTWLPEVARLLSLFSTFGLGILGALGWWWLSEPDPGRRDGPAEADTGRTWRRVLRASLIVSLVFTVVVTVLQLFPQFATAMVPTTPTAPTTPTTPTGGPGAPVILPPITAWVIAFLLLTGVAFVVQMLVMVASMMYLRTIAPRVPSGQMEQLCKVVAWLGPVLSTVGILLCMMGPLIAMILIIVVLEMLRGPIAAIRKRRRLAGGGAAVSPA
jgi:hypothetical protein